MKKITASLLGAVFVAAAVVAAGCTASNGDRQAPEASPSTEFAIQDVTTGASPKDSPHTVGAESEINAIGETAPSTAEAEHNEPNNAPSVAGQDELFLQNTRDVEVDLGKHRQLLYRDAIRPIYDPVFTSAQDAGLDPEELVIGVGINGDLRAYPIGPLIRREMVNDVVGGVPILVTW